MTPSEKGAVAELAIALAAAKLGLGVSRPMLEGERYDLVLDMRPGLLRVQCKWAVFRGSVVEVRLATWRRTLDGLRSTTYDEAEIDAVGAYCAALDRCYLLPMPLVSGRRAVYLRLSTTRNNQTRRINWAQQYELGAIAQLGERLRGTQEVAGSSPASSISPPGSSAR